MRKFLSNYWYWLRHNPRFFAVRILCEVGIHDYDKERPEESEYDPVSKKHVVRTTAVYCQKCCKKKVLGAPHGTQHGTR